MSTYKPSRLKRWTLPSSYMGATFEGFYYAPCTQTRDSGPLERSNYRTQARILAQCPEKEIPGDEIGMVTVQDHRFGHFLCGWYEAVLIHESDEDALAVADDIARRLEDYPVLDEEDYCREEEEEALACWRAFSVRDRIRAIQRYCRGVSIFAARRDEPPEDDTGSLRAYLARG